MIAFSNLLMDRNEYILYSISNSLREINTIYPAKIIAIDSLTKMYSIQPLIRTFPEQPQKPKALPIIENVPILRDMGGNAGIIIEYKVDDVVLVGSCQRDITAMITSKIDPKLFNPESNRKFSLSDSIILNRISFNDPNIFIKITDDGIDIDSKDKVISIKSSDVSIEASKVSIKSSNISMGSGTDMQPVALAKSIVINAQNIPIGTIQPISCSKSVSASTA